MTRRELLLSMAVGAVAVTLGGALSRAGAATTEPSAAGGASGVFTPGPVAPSVQPFPLSDVRLLDGPFLAAQQRDAKYLLSLEPDRMLHNFRVNAGLDPKAPIYAGWESVATWANIRCHGHTLGHYLTACSMMYASTGNEQFKQRCDYIVAELQECQVAGKTGLVCAFPDGATQFDNIAAGRRIVGVPWYTMHKIMAGLRDAHVYSASPGALEVLVKLCDWAEATTHNLTDAQFQRMLNTEHGGMNEVLADVS
ncbi:MAG: beta-L-arabinofuranosidase domain-containing protein, partial [Tepidisphaeraceae bacterium]